MCLLTVHASTCLMSGNSLSRVRESRRVCEISHTRVQSVLVFLGF